MCKNEFRENCIHENVDVDAADVDGAEVEQQQSRNEQKNNTRLLYLLSIGYACLCDFHMGYEYSLYT